MFYLSFISGKLFPGEARKIFWKINKEQLQVLRWKAKLYLSDCFVFTLDLYWNKRSIEGRSSWGSVAITCFFRVCLKCIASSTGNGFKGSSQLGKGMGESYRSLPLFLFILVLLTWKWEKGGLIKLEWSQTISGMRRNNSAIRRYDFDWFNHFNMKSMLQKYRFLKYFSWCYSIY